MNILNLSAEQFENLTFDIVTALGLRNAVWRTPGSDLGRDIEGEFFISDLSGQYQRQKWYVECKRYASSVDWPTVWNKIAYAENHNADILLFVTSSSLSPQAVDQVRIWNDSNKKPTIRFWGEVELCAKLNLHSQIAKKYGLKSEVDSKLEAFLPSIDFLLRITNSLSPEIGEVSQAKLLLLHAFSELITNRMLDVQSGYGFCFKEHTANDYFDWVDTDNVSFLPFDKYSMRALLAYLYFVLKKEPVIIQESSKIIKLIFLRELMESELSHLKVISGLSNFIITKEQRSIILELI